MKKDKKQLEVLNIEYNDLENVWLNEIINDFIDYLFEKLSHSRDIPDEVEDGSMLAVNDYNCRDGVEIYE